MNTILANAVASITLGIEDYKSEGRHRSLSALRNISAGILLLFKAKLAQLAPDETLIKKDFKLAWQDGQTSWTAKGDKTIDYQGIQDRFALVGIRFDFKEMDRIIKQRNRIEHYVADVPFEANVGDTRVRVTKERLTKPFDIPPTDERASEREERLMYVCSLLVPDTQSTEAV
jgi:hypothetical protein